MADIDFSLDDYIKTKRKQGGFKVNAAKKAQQQQRKGKKGKVAVIANRGKKSNRGLRARTSIGGRGGGQQQPRRGQSQQQIRQSRQASWKKSGRGGGGNRSRLNRSNNSAMANQLVPISPRKFNNRRGNAANLGNLRLQGQGRRNRNRGAAGGMGNMGISQHLVGNRRQNRARISHLQIQSPRISGRFGNKRAVLKLAQKRVQRARLQLTNLRRVVPRGNFQRLGGMQKPLMPLLSVTSGLRRIRNGFVTVKNPVEKQIQRLVIQEKIQKARQNRNNRNFNKYPSYQAQRNVSQQRQRPNQGNRNRFTRFFEASLPQQQPSFSRNRRVQMPNQYDPQYPEIPRMGMSMYADQEDRRMSSRGSGIDGGGGGWNPPLVRTAINPQAYSSQHPRDDLDGFNYGLNPEIQKKINFIQNRTRNIDSPGILPDFRAPIASSAMKLGDRFKMYMQ